MKNKAVPNYVYFALFHERKDSLSAPPAEKGKAGITGSFQWIKLDPLMQSAQSRPSEGEPLKKVESCPRWNPFFHSAVLGTIEEDCIKRAARYTCSLVFGPITGRRAPKWGMPELMLFWIFGWGSLSWHLLLNRFFEPPGFRTVLVYFCLLETAVSSRNFIATSISKVWRAWDTFLLWVLLDTTVFWMCPDFHRFHPCFTKKE